MKEWLVRRPSEEDLKINMPNKPINWWFLFDGNQERTGTSTLSKWVCPECGINVRIVRIGINGNPEIVHEPCSVKKGEKIFFCEVKLKILNSC